MEDDIVELWSSLKTNKGKKNIFKKHECNEMNKEICFVIDTKPDLKNLDCLKISTDFANKRRKLYHKIDKATLVNQFVKQVTSKDFKQSQKTKQHNNNAYLNIMSKKAQSRKKKQQKKKRKMSSFKSSFKFSYRFCMESSFKFNFKFQSKFK